MLRVLVVLRIRVARQILVRFSGTARLVRGELMLRRSEVVELSAGNVCIRHRG